LYKCVIYTGNLYIIYTSIQRKNFAEESKFCWRWRDMKIILLGQQNNFVGTLKIMSNAAKNVDVLATSLSIL